MSNKMFFTYLEKVKGKQAENFRINGFFYGIILLSFGFQKDFILEGLKSAVVDFKLSWLIQFIDKTLGLCRVVESLEKVTVLLNSCVKVMKLSESNESLSCRSENVVFDSNVPHRWSFQWQRASRGPGGPVGAAGSRLPTGTGRSGGRPGPNRTSAELSKTLVLFNWFLHISLRRCLVH